MFDIKKARETLKRRTRRVGYFLIKTKAITAYSDECYNLTYDAHLWHPFTLITLLATWLCAIPYSVSAPYTLGEVWADVTKEFTAKVDTTRYPHKL